MKFHKKHMLWCIPIVLLYSVSMQAWEKKPGAGPEKESTEYANWKNRPKEGFANPAASFEMVKKELLKNYVDQGITEEDLYRAAVEGMLSNIDPSKSAWNKLLTPTEYAELIGDIQGKIVGVGIEIAFNDTTGYADVMGVIPGTPAEKSGISRGDQILRIDGQSFRGKQLRDMVYAIRGNPGSEVKLSILHDDDVKVVRIKREALVWDSVNAKMLDKDFALLTIRNFTEATPELLKKNLNNLKSKGIKGLVVDLRGNEGGAFERTIESIQAFVPKDKLIVKVNKRGAQKEDILGTGVPILKDVPLIVLINGSTKSGAEIMAGALKMSCGATTVGTHSFGKWSAQQVEELPNKYAIKYTTATFLAPDGSDLTGKGLSPDIVVELADDLAQKLQSQPNLELRLQSDIQLQTAIHILKLKG